MLPKLKPLKINKANVQALIENQSGQYSRSGVVEAFNMFANDPAEIEKWVDQLLKVWNVEERKGLYFWVE